MKKITTIFTIVLSILMINNNSQAQAFKKGTINVDLGIGYGLYRTSSSHTEERTATVDPSTGLPSNFLNYNRTRDTTDGALSTVIPLSLEYGLSEKIGVGIDITYNSYYIQDSDKVDLKSVKAFDFGPKFNYHPLNSDFYDLVFGLGVGFTSIKWNAAATSNSDDYSGSGFYLNLDIKNKFWFSEHIGAYLNLGYKGNFYSAINRDTSSDELDLESLSYVSNVTIKDEFSFNLHGANIGVGLAVKF